MISYGLTEAERACMLGKRKHLQSDRKNLLFRFVDFAQALAKALQPIINRVDVGVSYSVDRSTESTDSRFS